MAKNKPKDDMMLPYLHESNQSKTGKIKEYASIVRDNAKYFVMGSVFLAAVAVVGIRAYDAERRTSPIEFKNFPQNVLSIREVNIPSKYHDGRVLDDIVYVERTQPDNTYKINRHNDSTESIEGEFGYTIRSGSSLETEGYGSAIRKGKVIANVEQNK